VRNNTNGATLGIDGAWKVANVATTTMTLVPMPGNTPPADFALTNCGGGLIKRTELRVSFVRVFDFERQRVEMLARPSGDASAAAPMTIQGTAAVSIATNTPTLAAGTNRAGFVAGSGIWYDDSSTVLAANATFTGTSRDATVTATATAFANAATFAEEVRVSAESDVSGTLWLEVSRDNTNWRRAKSVATAAITGGGQYAEIVHAPSWRYWRAGFTNGATLQARFSIGSLATAA
jgi:hypothetical protein